MPPERPRERRHHKDRYKPYRRSYLTPSERPSPFTYADELYEKLRRQLRRSVREEIEDDVQEFLNIISPSELVRSSGDNVSCIPPMHWHPRAIIQSGADLYYLQEAGMEASLSPEAKKAAEKVISYWTSANSLKQLNRFVDARQPGLLEIPTPDGSNIPDNVVNDPKESLLSEWMFRRIFVRCLHLPGLWFTGEIPTERFKAFGVLYGIARCLLEFELQRCPEEGGGFTDDYRINVHNPEAETFLWIGESRAKIVDVLDEVASVAYVQHGSLGSQFFPNKAGPALTREQILERNLTSQYMPKILDLMIKKYEELMSKHPFERLIMDLLAKEDALERLLSQEHIEDRLIHKQIVPFDELDMTGGPDYGALDIDSAFQEEDGKVATGILLETFIYKIAPAISLVNRQRRNFRLLREWIEERPWLRLLHVYNPDIEGNEWQREAIHEFCDLDLQRVVNMDPIIPTQPANIRANLFGIWPRDIAGDHVFGGVDFFYCKLCHEQTKGGDELTNTMAILDCAGDLHVFHFGCLLEFWDQEGKYTHDCPECGMIPTLPHVRLGMYPDPEDEVFNTSHPTFVDNSYGLVHPPLEPGELIDLDNYDVPPRYHDSYRYWRQEHALSTVISDAPIAWKRREMTENLAADEESGDQTFYRLVRDIGHRWRMRNLDRLASEDHAMDDAFESVRFAPSQEVAWLRMVRRRRNRIRRYDIQDAGEGMSRYIPRRR